MAKRLKPNANRLLASVNLMSKAIRLTRLPHDGLTDLMRPDFEGLSMTSYVAVAKCHGSGHLPFHDLLFHDLLFPNE